MQMSRLRRIKALLIDLNGTIHVGKETTPGAVQALDRLRKEKIPFIFCSNNTKESTRDVVRRLANMGIDVKSEEILTSLGACRQLVQKRGLNPYLMLSPSAKEEFGHTQSCLDDFDSVIVGLHGPSLSYDSLNIAFRILKGEPLSNRASASGNPPSNQPRARVLIAPHTAAFMQSPATDVLPAGLSMGIGPFVKALEVASGVEAEIVGKPTKRFFEMAVERLRSLYPDDQLEMNEIGVVGDDVENDLGAGAEELRLRRVLGKYRDGDEDIQNPPEAVFDSFAGLVKEMLPP